MGCYLGEMRDLPSRCEVKVDKIEWEFEVKTIWNDAMGFMGCELMRRVLGVAKRKDLEGIEDEKVKLQAESLVLDIGERTINAGAGERPIKDAASLFDEIRMMCAKRGMVIVK